MIEKLTNEEIEGILAEHKEYVCPYGRLSMEIQEIVKQQRDDLADQIQLTNDWKNFFKDMRRQRDECLPWLKMLVVFDGCGVVKIKNIEAVKALINTLTSNN
jgi:hypothetical protein